MSVTKLAGAVADVIDELHTSDEERARLALEEKKVEAEVLMGQQRVNEAEAGHRSVFVAGWRPFIGWVGGIAMAYQFVLYPLLLWLLAVAQGAGRLVGVEAPPVLDADALWVVVSGMLGVAGMRSWDKRSRVQTDRIK